MTGDFHNDLDRFGPGVADRPAVSLPEAQAYCRRLARGHYENFPLVSWLLPRRLHQHFYNVYAFCRWADDLGDEVGNAGRSLELLAWWRQEFTVCYAGRATHPVFVALKETIAEFDLPAEPFHDLIAAFEQDQRVREYGTFAELLDYCRRSANPVGRLVLAMCRAATEQNVRWSDSICTGLQLANFWQDVARDLDIGRVYLPAEDRDRFGYTSDDLQRRVTNQAFLDLMRFEVDRARQFLIAGLPLVEQLPFRLQVDVELFARGGMRILDRIERIGYRVWDIRPEVTKRDALGLLIAAFGRGVRRRLSPRASNSRPAARSELQNLNPEGMAHTNPPA